MDDLYYECYQTSNVKNVEKAIRPSMLLRHHINFNFCLERKIFNWVQNPDSDRPEFVGADRRPPSRIDTSARLAVGKPLSKERREDLEREAVEEMRQAVETAVDAVLAPLPLSDDNRRRLIERAWSEASTISNRILSRSKVSMDVYFEVLVVDHHIHYSLPEIGHVPMVPAADSSVQSLKKYEVGSGNMTELSCCICLEDFSGGGDDGEGCEALCMPCEHVFHGDCIKKWLQTSHYCPLCRFEMPTS